jgi:hypothetical protein
VTLHTDIRYEGLDCTGFLADVSRTGAFVRAGDEADPLFGVLQLGDWLELHLAPIGSKPLVIPARVVRMLGHGIGVEFGQTEPRFDAEVGAAAL